MESGINSWGHRGWQQAQEFLVGNDIAILSPLANGSIERTMVRKGDTECEYFSPAVLARRDGMLLLT